MEKSSNVLVKSKSLIYIFFYVIFGILNLYGTKSFSLGLIITFIEYAIVLFLIVRGFYYKALIAFLAFTSLTLEMNAYIYLNGEGPFSRYHFLNPPYFGELLYDGLACALCFLICTKYKEPQHQRNNSGHFFIRWLWILGALGLLAITIGMLFDDNNMMRTGWYPKLPLSYFFKYVAFACFCISFYRISQSKHRNELEKNVLEILLSVAIVGVLSVILGFHGYYGQNEKIMLAPLAICFSPILLLFVADKRKYELVFVTISCLVIVLSFNHSLVVGSKWYLILALTLVYYMYQKMHIQSIWTLILLAIGFLILLPILSNLLIALINLNEFDKFKFNQTVSFLNLFSYNSFYDWFLNLDESAQFRVDEPINIVQEYLNKPGYVLFGKGFGGTVLHYTPFCDWDTPSAFTEEQRIYGLYYSMHESFSVLLLRHGLVGVVFFITVLANLLKKWNNTPWVVLAILWFVFYWSFGISFRIGIVALMLTFTSSDSTSNG